MPVMSDSVFACCSAAIREMAVADTLISDSVVVARALAGRDVYDETFYRAHDDAAQALYQAFLVGRLVRYGIVLAGEAPGVKEDDYVRDCGSIAYASAAHGPEQLTTPNGTFERIPHVEDPIRKTGRRAGQTLRDDLRLTWEQQRDARSPGVAVRDFLIDAETQAQEGIAAAQADIRRLQTENDRLHAEVARLR